jgi:hypothetical protein
MTKKARKARKAKSGTAGSFGGPSFGTFTIGHPDEVAFVVDLQQKAIANTRFPGTFHARLQAQDQTTGEVVATKTYHIDLNKRELVVEEERQGRLTARATLHLGDEPDDADTRPPTLNPGPERPAFVRESFAAADLNIDDEFREWSMSTIDARLPGLAAVECCLGVFREGQQDCYQPAHCLLPANVARMGATLAKMRRAPRVVRALAEGWLDTGEPTGLAFSLEWLEGEGWWVATRPFRRVPGPIGEWTGPWQEREGEGPDGLPTALRALRFPLPTAEAWVTGEPKALEIDEMEVHGGELGADLPAPTTAEGWAGLVAEAYERDAAAQNPPPQPRLFVFRGRRFERYHLDGPLPTDIDDFIRNVLLRGAPPDAVALVQQGLVPIERGALARCLLTVAESAGRRHVRALEMRMSAEGRVRAVRHLRLESDDSEPQWLGVEPITRLSATERMADPEG